VARHLLSARRVTALLSGGRPRRYGDGGCLYLQINGPNRGAWVFMTKRGGKQRPIGLGSVRDVSLKDARELADACRRAVSLGRDPKTVLADAAGELTFDTAARELIESMASGWRNAKHCAQWRMTLLGEMVAKDDSTKKTRYNYCAVIRHKPDPSSPPKMRCGCSGRCGRPDLRRQIACAAGVSVCGTSPRRAVIALARTRSGGADTSTSCCRSGSY
jgi:Arm DNA-binding domain